MRLRRWSSLIALGLSLSATTALAATEITHAIALRSTPKYPANFLAFEYTNPKAPKGGDIRLSEVGTTFDSLNGFINKGVPAAGIDHIYDSLTTASMDEPFTQYGLLAEKIEHDFNDSSWVTYYINPKARFSDGKPVTAQDVVFTFNTILKDGDPNLKQYYSQVKSVQALAPLKVKFTFKTRDVAELPLIVGQQQILPKHYWEKRTFFKTSLDIPVGSGPYKISRVDPGRSISYTLDPNYWGKDLSVNRGRNNFGSITYVYYRDPLVALQGFKAGQYDFRAENKAKDWASEYNFPAAKQGWVKKMEQKHFSPTGMQGFVYNTRHPIFQDPRVREALSYAFDFEWTNKTLFYGAYTRTESYFSNSELAAQGMPSKDELAILEPYRQQLPASVFGDAYHAPRTDGTGNIRQNLVKAQTLLADAGWTIKNGKLTDARNNPFTFEILLDNPQFTRIVEPFTKNLERLGIEAKIRLLADTSQYTERLRKFDYDMIVNVWGESLSPGSEQEGFWGSKAADIPGSRNFSGIKSPVVDELVKLVATAPTREQLTYRTRALDRVLMAGYYVIPQYHFDKFRIAYWDFFEYPQIYPKYGLDLDSWWVNPQKANKIRSVQSSLGN